MITALQQYIEMGGAILLLSLDGAPQTVLDTVVTVTEENRFDLALGLYQGTTRGYFHDPERWWDAAIVDKCIVVGSLLPRTG